MSSESSSEEEKVREIEEESLFCNDFVRVVFDGGCCDVCQENVLIGMTFLGSEDGEFGFRICSLCLNGWVQNLLALQRATEHLLETE